MQSRKNSVIFFESKWRHGLRERAANLHGGRALTLGSALNSAKHIEMLTATSAAPLFSFIQLNQ